MTKPHAVISKIDALPMTLAEQVHILLSYGIPRDRHATTLAAIAASLDISAQTLANLRDGTTDNPRLHTLRSLTQFYGISLDYFACTSRNECYAFIEQHTSADHLSSVDAVIREQAQQLSPSGKHNLQTIIHWRWRAAHQT